MFCIECGGELEQTDPRSWDCLACGAELQKGEDGKVFVGGYHDVDDVDDEESISVWDAADIYLSKGFDEDYRFGYTDDELRKALGEQ